MILSSNFGLTPSLSLKIDFNLCKFGENGFEMNTSAEKVDIIQWIAGLKDQSILEQLKMMKDQTIKNADWWDNISIEERQSIERGLEDSKNGRVTPHTEVRKRYEKWL
jgi:hypothetical protein